MALGVLWWRQVIVNNNNNRSWWARYGRSLLLLGIHWCCTALVQHDTTCLFPVSDWETLNWAKMAALIDNSTQFTYGMGLVPWYLPGYILPAGKAATLVCTVQIWNALHTQHCTVYAYFLHTRTYCMPLQHKLRAGVKARQYSASEICGYNANESCTRNSSFPLVGFFQSAWGFPEANCTDCRICPPACSQQRWCILTCNAALEAAVMRTHSAINRVMNARQCVLQGTRHQMPPTLQSRTHHDELRSSPQPDQLPQFQPLHQLPASHYLQQMAKWLPYLRQL